VCIPKRVKIEIGTKDRQKSLKVNLVVVVAATGEASDVRRPITSRALVAAR